MSGSCPFAVPLVVVAALFCCLRFVRLEQKLYWVDEVATSEHITYDIDEQISNELTSGDIKDIKQIASLIKFSGSATIGGTVGNLVATDPHHAPPYYLLLNLWSRLFGLEPGRLRLLSAVFSLAAAAALYWLALELFQSHTVAAIAVWLYALSPFQLIYAQQAREYSMWILLILLSSASLISASRRPRFRSWLVYFLLNSALLWTHLLSIWVVIAQAAFMVVHSRKDRRVLTAFGSAATLSFLVYAPWLIMIARWSELNDYGGIEKKIAPLLYVETFLLNLSRTLLDVGLPSYEHLPYSQGHLIVPIVATLVLIASCVWVFMRRATPELRILLSLLALSTMLPLILADAVVGGRRALLPRYDSPAWISLDLILAFSIGSALSTAKKRNLWAGSAALILVLCCGGYSQLQFLSRTIWWTSRPPDMAQAAVFLAENPSVPLTIDLSSFNPEEMISLAYFLHERPVVTIKDQDLNSANLRDVLVYRPSEELTRSIEESHSFSVQREAGCLLRFSRLQP